MKRTRLFLTAWVLGIGLAWIGWSAELVQADLCVYGGTSGGVVAAVTAARLGKSVVLVVMNNHLGGMSSGGLGVTDRGNATSIAGVSAEFYQRVGKAYGTNGPVYFFEPHLAENVFRQMIFESRIPVYTDQRLTSVMMSGKRISRVVMENGTAFEAKQFIDTTYEGDLIALAGVSFTVGREAMSVYGESLAGIQPLTSAYSYDPYLTPGNPASGLLPLVQPGNAGTPGEGDTRVQAYNFRLCLTQNATNKIPIAPPANYDESRYELVRRYVAARVVKDGSVTLNKLIDVQTIIPNGKTDINANGELSTDYVGGNYTYPTNTYAGRQQIWQEHEDYIRGLLHFYATSTNVPANVRTEMQSWGLAKDEFQDTGGWPHQLYVREARRMVGDYVMTQDDCQWKRTAPDPVCLGSYTIDSHGVQRLAEGALARWEGSLGSPVAIPYGISYRSIIPRAGECENVYCTFALSASHVAFASCRMEPVFMMTSQSAATAACFAIDDAVSSQMLKYDKLAAQLRADKQMLKWTCAPPYLTNTITLDQANTCFVTSSSGWATGANPGGWNGSYWHDGGSGKGAKWVRYTPDLPTNGVYDVYLWWVEAGNRAVNTPVDIVHPGGTNRVFLNQQVNGSVWNRVFRTNFTAGASSSVVIRNDGTASGSYCIANGVQWRPVGFTIPPPPAITPEVEVVAADPVACEFGTNYARFSLVRNNDSALKAVTVDYVVGGSAIPGVDYAALPGRITISAGAVATNVTVVPLGISLGQDSVSVTLTLQSSTNFSLTSLSNAACTILDRPLDSWRRSVFTSAELADPSFSADGADPNGDGYQNLIAYAMGLDPRGSNSTNLPAARVSGRFFEIVYPRSKAAIDVTLEAEVSSDLISWESGPAVTETIQVLEDGPIQHVLLRLAAPITARGAAFVRFRAQRL
jgi:hypothetical protein